MRSSAVPERTLARGDPARANASTDLDQRASPVKRPQRRVGVIRHGKRRFHARPSKHPLNPLNNPRRPLFDIQLGKEPSPPPPRTSRRS